MPYTIRPILVLEDDEDDVEIITQAFNDLKISNQLVFLQSGTELATYLSTHPAPFLIFCDFYLSGGNAIQVRKMIVASETMKHKSVPFIIWSTSAMESDVKNAYENYVQGFFVKPPSYEEIRETLSFIITYWSKSERPG